MPKVSKPAPRKKIRILLVDDERKYVEHLQKAHPKYIIDYTDNIDELDAELEKRWNADKWPDVLLLDVYWPKGNIKETAIKHSRKETHRILTTEVEPAIDRLNEAYLKAFQKWGTRVLGQIRQKYTDRILPVVMYSSKGHYLLRDDTQDWLSEAIEEKADWLCKGTVSARAEDLIFRSLASRPNSIFIGHGRSKEWKKLADYISNTLGLPVEEFNRVPPAGITTKDRIQSMLNKSAAAFLVATAEDLQADGTERARENVVHEIGLCQGRFGFERAIVMIEDGCTEFSNIHGVSQIRFEKGKIRKAFDQVVGVLQREGLLPRKLKRT